MTVFTLFMHESVRPSRMAVAIASGRLEKGNITLVLKREAQVANVALRNEIYLNRVVAL